MTGCTPHARQSRGPFKVSWMDGGVFRVSPMHPACVCVCLSVSVRHASQRHNCLLARQRRDLLELQTIRMQQSALLSSAGRSGPSAWLHPPVVADGSSGIFTASHLVPLCSSLHFPLAYAPTLATLSSSVPPSRGSCIASLRIAGPAYATLDSCHWYGPY
jgi:hypothetical protein